MTLINEADDAHLAMAFGTGKGVSFINSSDEARPILLNFLECWWRVNPRQCVNPW
jgi:hypothetical protein